jgi:3-hydroxyisobutyrate dehydrogenase-like beta-hydroxyacid dehydrogenase
VPAEPIRIGVLGLGRMGTAMARRLADCGYPPLLYNRTRTRVDRLARDGVGRVAASPAELGAASDIIVCTVAGDDAVREVLRAAARPGLLVINMGTIAASTATELATHAIAFLDAPVSGPPASARHGRLTILASGDTDLIRRADPVLRMLGSTVIAVGPCGAGSAMKAILNGAARTVIGALASAIDQGAAAGFDVDLTYEVLRHSMVASRVLEERRDLVMAARSDRPA